MSGQKLVSRAELYKLIDLKLPVAEIGCAEGLFSRDILKWGVPKLYMVDNWGTLDQTGDGGFEQEWHDKNFANVQKIYDKRVEILRGISWNMASRVPDSSLGLVYIDACHSYECVKMDIEAWFPKLVCGGVLAGHDINNNDYGVRRAVEEFCTGQLRFNIIPENGIDASFYFIKPC